MPEIEKEPETFSDQLPPADGRGFRPLVVTQFIGAFIDNAWKMVVVFLGIALATKGVDVGDPSQQAAFEHESQSQAFRAFLWMTLPLLVFSVPAALIADRFGKRDIIVLTKLVELALLVFATYFLATSPDAIAPLVVLLALLGAQSAFFSPAKYGILPELLPPERLVNGNGAIELFTMLAIITGTGAAGTLLEHTREVAWVVPATLVVLSCVGLIAALKIPRVPPSSLIARPDLRVYKESWVAIRGDRVLWLTVLGLTFFWAIATLLGQDLLVYARTILIRAGEETASADERAGWILASIGVGIGIGAYFAGRLSNARVEYGLVPLGSVALSLAAGLLAFAAPEQVVLEPLGPEGGAMTELARERANDLYWLLLLLVLPLGVASGLILVPLNATLQWRAPATRRGAVIALSNVFVFAGMVSGAFAARGFVALGWSAREILAGAAILVLVGTVWALTLLPEAFVRLVLVILTNTFYRLRVVGRDRLPATGGVLLVANHVSLVDGLLLLASTNRPVRFIVESEWVDRRFFRPFMKAIGAIPISTSGDPKTILRALKNAGAALDAGEVVCIFPEGQITRTGMLLPFRRGLERIVKGRSAAIVPVYLDRVWGSLFSWSDGRFLWKWPRRVPYPVSVVYGDPLPSGTPVGEIRRAVEELGADAWMLRRKDARPLHSELIRTMRRGPWRLAFADRERPRVSRLGALAGSVAIARAMRPRWAESERIGILLPASVAGALSNVAASLTGRPSVNLNPTAGREGMTSAARQAGLRSVLTSRRFVEKAKIELPDGVEPIWIEEVAGTIKLGQRVVAMLAALFLPRRLLERACGARGRISPDDVATVIFSSGSTGEPKGVLLTHFNVESNIAALSQVVRVRKTDRLLGVLPFFHSFGYAALWFASAEGIATVFHPNPLDAAAIGELVPRYRATILIGTPSFLQVWMRRCTPAQFGSLRLVLAGAERLPESLALAFEDHFGIRPLSAYGATECAPAVAVSVPDYRAPGFFQAGSRRGTVGHPLPGVRVRIVDPNEDFDPERTKPLPPGDSGLVVVRGPNVTIGYLDRDDLTREVLRGGWYLTGDIGTLDEDGFLAITDRLARFAKLGGEMVPLGRVEDALQEAAGVKERVFGVTAVPDPNKGERLVVLHTLGDIDIAGILDRLRAMGLPNLFIPRPEAFVSVEELPLLGSGKLDLRALRRIAEERTTESQSA